MKRFFSTLLACAALALIPVLVPGCATSSGVRNTDSAASKMGRTADEIEESRVQVARVMTALNELSKEGADIKGAYKTFSKEVSSLEGAADADDRSIERMKVTFQEYSNEWQQEIAAMSNEELKQQSAKRRSEVINEFEGVRTAVEGISQSFKPFRKDLQDLVTYLAADLSPAGISAAGTMISNLKTEGVAVQRDIQAAVTKIQSLRTSMGR